MRILLAVMTPLNPELGASQTALNLTAALRALGLKVVLWTPQPVPAEIRWWRRMAWMREAIAEYVRRDGPFDVVDVPPVAVTASLARQCTVIARSVQPDLIYLWTEAVTAGGGFFSKVASALFSVYLAVLVICGWFRASRILCLGTAELEWMRRRFPWWRKKLHVYMNATGDDERAALAEIRQARRPLSPDGVRFLWLGRWAAHKGVDVLLDFAARHLARSPHDCITIAGCGPEAERQVPPWLLREGRLRVVTSYTRRELPQLLAGHDAGLFTSRAEGWGLSLQEMLESGMPVYATEAGGVRDLMPYFSGQLGRFPPTPADLRKSEPARVDWSRYYEAFSWRTIARAYVAMVSGEEKAAR